jgi:hypothetical protein
MRKLISAVAAAALLVSGSVAFAADTQPSSDTSQSLAPGGAAGVHNAQGWWSGSTAFWVGGGIIAVGVGTAVILANNGGHGNTTKTTTTTTP